jgi:hypothetical protein
MSHQSFALRLELRSALLFERTPPMPDGVLAYHLVRSGLGVGEAPDHLPVSYLAGIPRLSGFRFEQIAHVAVRTIYGKLRIPNDLGLRPDNMAPGGFGMRKSALAAGRRTPYIEQNSGPMKTLSKTYTLVEADAVWISGLGDAQAIKQVFAEDGSIGARRNAGYGEIGHIDLFRSGAINPGIADAVGAPLRPVPLQIFEQQGLDLSLGRIREARTRSPYWKHEDLVACMTPLDDLQSYDQDDMAELLDVDGQLLH